MVDFRLPDVLDPGMVDLNARRVRGDDLVLTPPTLEEHFVKACAYGRALWQELAEVRRYLRDHIAGDHDGSGGPALLSDEADWQQWSNVYAHLCSTLAGTSGDSGFGQSEARLIARAHGVELPQQQ